MISFNLVINQCGNIKFIKPRAYLAIWIDSFLQSDRLLVGPDYLVRTAGIMNFSKIFQNLQNN